MGADLQATEPCTPRPDLNQAIAGTNAAVTDNLGTGFATVEAASTLNAAIEGTNSAGYDRLANGFATVEAASTLNAAIEGTNSVGYDRLANGFATVEAANTLNAAIDGTNSAGYDRLANGFATVEAASTANALQSEALAATAQALASGPNPTATITVTPTVQATPSPVPMTLRAVDLPALSLRISVPEGMPGPQPIETQAVLFGTDAGIAPRGIIVSRQTAADLHGSSDQSFVEGTNGDPVRVLQAALDDTAAAIGGQLTILQAPARLDNGLAPAAIARLQPAGMESEMAYVVVYLAEVVYHAPEEWLTLVFFGRPAELDQWIVPMVNSLRPVMVEALAATPPQQRQLP